MAGEWINGRDFQWLQPSQSDGTFMRGMQLGMQMRHQRINESIAMQEAESKVKLMDLNFQMKRAELRAYENLAEGNAQLATALSETAGKWTEPESKARFWGIASKYPQVMKSPQFKELVDNFQLADTAKARQDYLQSMVGGQKDLETLKQGHRLESLTTRLDRMSDMKMDDQAFKVEMEGLLQEHRLERDKAKASTSGTERFDLNKSDEIKMRSELNSLQIALNQGVLELPEFEAKREKVFKKYEAVARKPAQVTAPATKTGPAKRIRVKAPDGTIGHIPEDQLDEAKRNGYILAE